MKTDHIILEDCFSKKKCIILIMECWLIEKCKDLIKVIKYKIGITS